MSDDLVNIEVNGRTLQARKGQMLIEVTDDADVYVPRFCYHRNLSVAANCRMCLVEVEKAPKPLPACATPVNDGMKVYTRSPKAIAAQRATMEFLLINHPLDCPICDQGGECELQDIAMGFGRGVSRFTERKRVVKDKDLGPLVSTDMTRCIHCTRCVRFTQEIAGYQELGTIGRGERTEIGTYIERSVDHELSGNIIDLCPVGALNNKPYRYSARAWEMTQHALVAGHDCVGSAIHAHVLRGRLKRVVPRDNDAINETWASDRDRYSYEGLYSEDRLLRPLVRDRGGWHEVEWEQALTHVAERLRDTLGNDGDHLGTLCSPSATLEESYLLARIARHLGSGNLDHRLRARDTRDQASDPPFTALGTRIDALESHGAILVVASNLRREVPIIAHRVRKAALGGTRVSFINPARYEYLFPLSQYLEADAGALASELAALLAAAVEVTCTAVPAHLAGAVDGVQVDDGHRALARELANAEHATVMLGLLAQRHPALADIRALAAGVATLCGASFGALSEGANSAGAALAGMLPHREAGGTPAARPGRGMYEMFASPRKAYLLYGFEPDADTSDPELATKALASADFNVAFTQYDTEILRESCHVLLPVSAFPETSGTFVNVEGRWQSQAGASRAPGETRPGWKVLRVLGNLLELPDCDYVASTDVRDALLAAIGGEPAPAPLQTDFAASRAPAHVNTDALDIPIYAVDALVRRADALQQTRIAIESASAAPTARAVND